VSTGPGVNPINIRLSAAERLELNLTSAFIELGITSLTVWNKEAERVKEGRGTDAPFRVRNRTGLTILLWPEQNDLNKPVTGVKRLDDGADVPWRFEDRKSTRDVKSFPSLADIADSLYRMSQLLGITHLAYSFKTPHGKLYEASQSTEKELRTFR
jgi:hypothetical protein